MKNFSKAIEAVCLSCYVSETVRVETIKMAKAVLQENYGWTESKIGWVCEECSKNTQQY